MGQVLQSDNVEMQDLTLWSATIPYPVMSRRDARWSEAVAVESTSFVAKVKQELGAKARYR